MNPCRISTCALLGVLVTAASAQSLPQGPQQQPAGDRDRVADWHTLIPNTIDDQKRIFGTFPNDVAHGKHWIPVVTILAGTAGLVIADQYDAGYFRRSTSLSSFNSVFSSTSTAAATVLAPVGLYVGGLMAKEDYTKQTALLSGEAVLDGEILDYVLKTITDRTRPGSISPAGNFADSFMEGQSRLNASFPSAHTVAAFAIATVIARRYGRRHRWVPVLAYGLSTAVGMSRISLSAHFPSDVFFGGVLGYSIGRFAVLHE